MTAATPASTAPETASEAQAILAPEASTEALETLEHEITTLAAHIQAATHRLLVLLAEFDGRKGWERADHRSCAHWLHARTGLDLGAAREKVRVARRWKSCPGRARP